MRRPLRAHSPAVHGLLRHLEAVGFDGAPRVLGIDEVGREVLSWVPGDVPDRPIETQYVSEDVLRGVGRLLRRYHEAVASYEAPNGAPWTGRRPIWTESPRSSGTVM